MIQSSTAVRLRRTEAAAHVPLADLAAQYQSIAHELNAAVLRVAESGTYVLGPEVSRFENAFAAFVGARHCVGVNSGTSALHLALLCAGVGPGDEVITVPMTFVATCWAISYAGATPVFVDIDPRTYTMDVTQVESKITPRTKAILPVHLYGQPADLTPLLELGQRHGIPVIEDAAQSHGAAYDGKITGSMGLCGCFSFYPGKNLGACGEAGAVVTNDDAVAARLRALRDHAQRERYHHEELGFNYRMEAMQGAVLGVKLAHLGHWTTKRQALAKRYLQGLEDVPLELPSTAPGRTHVWHLFVVQHPRRDWLRDELQRRGVSTGLHYPVPVHLQKAYAHLGHRPGEFPVAEQVARQCLTLPLYAEMSPEQQDVVIEAARAALS